MIRKFGEFELDINLRRLSRRGQQVRLTGQALDLLCLLVNREGDLVTRREIEQHLWPDSNVDFDHSVDVLVSRLRNAVGDSGRNPRYIETVPKQGYRFLGECGTESHWHRQFEKSIERIGTYATITLLAATISVLIAHTRYQKFIPPERPPVVTNPVLSPTN